ncbi:MAG: GNAT family N-acetyltransferase [Candidatus Bathyarchaeota archaeon]|nr:GNAT family N-acetyltransferase [Candidatus Bathyarchaeota archaeon]MDH5532703.1 GNAT family N-acetyltransferase [Candidatus Bathyarchaeota archaeon]
MKPADNLVVREAVNQDVEGIIRVFKTTYLKDESWARSALRRLLATSNYVMLVAELGGIVVGYADYYVLPSIWEKWNEATVNYLFVHKDYQGKGIGSKLLEEVVKRADKVGIAEIHVATEKGNEQAIRLYKKHGFLKEYVLLERVREPVHQLSENY